VINVTLWSLFPFWNTLSNSSSVLPQGPVVMSIWDYGERWWTGG